MCVCFHDLHFYEIEAGASSWTTEGSGYDSVQEQEAFLRNIHTGPGAHPVSLTMSIRGSFLRGEESWREAELHLLSRLTIVELYIYSSICLHGLALN
jgi:hypothetical protein